ncbi:MAG: hypothetical protein ACOCTT_00550, partial [archaeon]
TIDRIMNSKMNERKKRVPDTKNNIKINFSVERNGENPTEIKQSVGPRKKPVKEMLDIIDKGKHVNVIIELGESPEEEEIETELIENKLTIRTPGIYKELPLTGRLKRIKEKNYKNNILEIKIEKEE